MNETNTLRPGGMPPWGFLGMLLLVALIEGGVFRDNLNFCNTTGLCWKLATRDLGRRATGREILCFGDSMLRFGLIPRTIGERTGRPAASLAIAGGSPASSYFLLRRTLDAGAHPSVVVVDACKDLLRYGPASTVNVYPWAEILDLRESLELCWGARDPGLFAQISLARLFPSARYRFEVRDYVRKAFLAEEAPLLAAGLSILRNWNRNRDDGAMVLGKVPFQDGPAPPEKDRGRGNWEPDPVNVEFLRKFLALAEERRIRVVWLLLPTSPGSQAAEEFVGNEARYEAFVRAEQRRRPDLVVLDARHTRLDVSSFHDANHLNRDGAAAMSAVVADALRGAVDTQPAPPGRWVAAAETCPPVKEAPLEDLDQSWLAIKNVLDASRRR